MVDQPGKLNLTSKPQGIPPEDPKVPPREDKDAALEQQDPNAAALALQDPSIDAARNAADGAAIFELECKILWEQFCRKRGYFGDWHGESPLTQEAFRWLIKELRK